MSLIPLGTSTNALYAAALHDRAWISSLHSHINPLSLTPPDDVAEIIDEEWHDVLRSFLVQDLKDDAFGQRMHLWSKKNCLIVYYLNATRSLLKLAEFYQLNDESYIDMYECFARNATWIFCPQTSGSCSQVFGIASRSLNRLTNFTTRTRRLCWLRSQRAVQDLRRGTNAVQDYHFPSLLPSLHVFRPPSPPAVPLNRRPQLK